MLQQPSLNPNDNQIQADNSSIIEIESEVATLPADETSLSIQIPANELRIPSIQRTTMKAEQGCFFRKTSAIVISMITWMILAIGETNVIKKLENLSLLAFCCIIYTMIENMAFCFRQIPAQSQTVIKEHLFDALDGVLALYFLLAIEFWDGDNATKPLLYFSLGLFLLTTSIYLRLTLTSSISKGALIRRICYTAQVWLIILKLIGSVAYDWMIIFLPLGLYLVGHQVYGSFILIGSSIQLVRRIERGETDNLSFIRRAVRMSWDVVHFGLLLATFGMALNLCNVIENEQNDEGLIKTFFTVSQCYSGLFLGYALIFLKLLKDFDYNMIINSDLENNIKKSASKKKHSFVPQKDLLVCDFLKISPTYFVKSEGEIEKHTIVRSEEAEEEVCCYICEENKPDTILMGCGHGGMCTNCALLSMKKNNNCMQCRKPIQLIYQITEEDKSTKVVKASEAFSIVFE